MSGGSLPESTDEDGLLLGATFFVFNLVEEGGELVVVFLAPFLEGVMMAAGALDALAEKELGGIFDAGFGIGDFAQPDDGGMVFSGTGSG